MISRKERWPGSSAVEKRLTNGSGGREITKQATDEKGEKSDV
jgi:hypothetical protein